MKRASKTLLLLAAAAALAAVHLPGAALADGARARPASTKAKPAAKPAPAEKAGRPAADPRRARNFDFLGDDVTGEGMLPRGENVSVAGPVEHGNLIRLRTHFVREIAASANHL
jgi:hypothetical protein